MLINIVAPAKVEEQLGPSLFLQQPVDGQLTRTSTNAERGYAPGCQNNVVDVLLVWCAPSIKMPRCFVFVAQWRLNEAKATGTAVWSYLELMGGHFSAATCT